MTPSGPTARDRVLLLVQHAGNRRWLGDWLTNRYEVLQADGPAALDETFDLCIVDALALDRLLERVTACRQREHPVFLPVLLVTSRQGLGMTVPILWHNVDEVIVSPIEPVELQARVEMLLRARHLSRHNVALRRQAEGDLAAARLVQTALLPGTHLDLPGFELAARCLPAREVGGDFYDWEQPAPGVLTLTLADVMGKGMGAALLTATVRSTLRALAILNPPGTVLELAHSALEPDFDRSGSFVTLVHARLDLASRRLTYADAGHGYGFVRRASGKLDTLSVRGLPLGVFPNQPYEEGQMGLDPGDVLVLYSDGLAEFRRDAILTPEALAERVARAATADDMVERLTVRPRPGEPPLDDLTVVVLRCRKES
ncbi:MAG: PP2C family protein-serine/threonine phosphatase [Nitrospirales bacterium]